MDRNRALGCLLGEPGQQPPVGERVLLRRLRMAGFPVADSLAGDADHGGHLGEGHPGCLARFAGAAGREIVPGPGDQGEIGGAHKIESRAR